MFKIFLRVARSPWWERVDVTQRTTTFDVSENFIRVRVNENKTELKILKVERSSWLGLTYIEPLPLVPPISLEINERLNLKYKRSCDESIQGSTGDEK